MNRPLIVLGAGGHAKVLIDALLAGGIENIIGLADPAPLVREVLGVPVIGGDQAVSRHAPETVRLVNGLGTVRASGARQALYARFKAQGYEFAQVIHPSAILARALQIGEGAQIMAGCVIQPGCVLGENVIINTRASLDHDCRIGAHSHVAPGAVLSGGVTLGEGVHLGTGAVVIQGVAIGAGGTVGAGAVVLDDLPAGVTAFGVPARVA
jgi:UDP-perosamine 4-acetyltransferase